MILLLYHMVCSSVLFLSTGFETVQDEKVYTVSEVSTKPEPLMGQHTFQKKWSSKVAYPGDAIKEKVEGMVYIEFVVDKDGSIRDAAVRSGLGFGCDEAALEGFKEVSKDAWRPGVKNDLPVKVKMVLPFQFRIIKM